MRSLYLAVLVVLLMIHRAHAVPVVGKLLEKGTRTPLEGVSVFVLPPGLKAVTDEDGDFSFPDVPEGDFKLVVNRSGYEKLENELIVEKDVEGIPYELFLEKSSYQVYETVIVDQDKRRDQTSKSLSAKQIANLPGAGGDPIKAVQNLPGVSRAPAFSSQVIIQGSAPEDTRYLIEGHEVPIIFHFGGLTSVVNPDALDRVEYLSAGYGAPHGWALGGLVGAWTQKPKPDRLHGMAFVDIFNSGGFVEGPVGKKSSFFFGLRKSYVGTVLKKAFENEEDFNLTVAPSFSDLTGVYDTELTDRDHFRLVSVGSEDRLEFLLKEPVKTDPTFRGRFSSKTSFFRIIPSLEHDHGDSKKSKFSLGLGRDYIRFENGENFFFLKTLSLTTRAEYESKLTDFWTSFVGLDTRHYWANVALELPNYYEQGGVVNPLSSGEKRLYSADSTSHAVGAYWTHSIEPKGSRWTFLPAIRGDYYHASKEFLPVPRLAANYQLDPSMKLKSATGVYTQPPRPEEIVEGFGNPNLKSPRALHGMLGAEKDFRENQSEGFVLSGGGFYRLFDRLVVQSTKINSVNGYQVPERYSNDGRGRAFGAEGLLRYDFQPWSGWVSYTLSRSTRWTVGNEKQEYLSSYDQTHNLNMILARDLPKNWKISGRFRYVSGNPTTPITGGIFDADQDVYVPVRGSYFSDRLDPFYQLDLRFDKKWIYNKWILSLYLDIQNVTNRKNTESYEYAYHYKSKTKVSGLPILPTFGVKGEF